MGLFYAGIVQTEPDGLAELAGAWRAETHYHWRCHTHRRDEELTLHAGLSLWFRTSGPKLNAPGFILKISRLCRELLHLCNNTRDVVNLQHLLTGDATHKAMSQMLQTTEFDEDLQAELTVLFGWTAQNRFKMHMCDIDCIIWTRQSSRELRGCGKRSWFRQNFTGVTLCLQCWVTVGTWAHVTVNQTLRKEGKDGNKIFINQWKHCLIKRKTGRISMKWDRGSSTNVASQCH